MFPKEPYSRLCSIHFLCISGCVSGVNRGVSAEFAFQRASGGVSRISSFALSFLSLSLRKQECFRVIIFFFSQVNVFLCDCRGVSKTIIKGEKNASFSPHKRRCFH